MQKVNSKILLLIIGLILPTTCYKASASSILDGLHPIQIHEAQVESTPKGSSIQVSLDGHWLTVTFTQDIGTVTMELDMASGPMIFNYPSVGTPDSFQFYLPLTGDYIITFNLSNGDEYYGEFTITD